jgi:NAD+ synthase
MLQLNLDETRLRGEIENSTDFIRKHFAGTGRTTAVLGLSGGLDSAVTAALLVSALGAENVYAFFIDIYSSPGSYADAKRIAEHLGIELTYVNLNEIYDLRVKRLGLEGNDLAKGNIKARERMIELYAQNEILGGLVVNTCNKSETMVGYETKWGDAAGDLAPLGNYYKTELFAMARLLDLPQWLVEKIPSADLWDGQSDEDEMGITYALLDLILETLENHPEYLSELPFVKIEKVQRMIAGSAHKRQLPPPARRRVPAELLKAA